MQVPQALLLSSCERLRRDWVATQRLLRQAQDAGLDTAELCRRERLAYEAYVLAEREAQAVNGARLTA